MRPVFRDTVRDCVLGTGEIGVLALLSEAGYLIAARFDLLLPGNLVGMLLLLALLATGLLRLHWIERGASFLLRHLAFFFVPIAVGIMSFGDLLRASGLVLLAVLLASTLAGIFVAGHVAQALARGGGQARADGPNGSRMEAS